MPDISGGGGVIASQAPVWVLTYETGIYVPPWAKSRRAFRADKAKKEDAFRAVGIRNILFFYQFLTKS